METEMMLTSAEPGEDNHFLAKHVQLLRTSFHRLTGRELVNAALDDIEAAREVFHAPCVIVSHDTASDPIFNYANKMALRLFDMTWDEIITLPSRKSAEMPDREERARLLAEVTTHGFIDNYSGVRISKSGQRFLIEQATVWNLVDEDGVYRGQAATFSHWKFL